MRAPAPAMRAVRCAARAAAAAVALSVALLLGGCYYMDYAINEQTLKEEIRDSDMAEEHLLAYLEKKYGEWFAIIGEVTTKHQSTGGDIFTGTFAPLPDPSKTFEAGMFSEGGPTDDYGKYVFKDEVEGYCWGALEGNEDFGRYETELVMPPSMLRWGDGQPVESFLGDRGWWDPYVVVRAWLRPGLSDEEYAVQIRGLVEDLADLPCAVEVRIHEGDLEVFLFKILEGRPLRESDESIAMSLYTSRAFDERHKEEDAEKERQWAGSDAAEGAGGE